jgi:hypothetical protein
LRFPKTVGEITPGILTELIAERHPGAVVKSITLVEALVYGSGTVSTSDRVVLDLNYAPGSPPGLLERVVVKTMIETPHAPGALYENETQFYARLRSELTLETPRCLGAIYDAESTQFAVLLEDLRLRQVQFLNVQSEVSLRTIEGLLTVLAGLHAQFWNSGRFAGDLTWVQTHVAGPLFDFFNTYQVPMAHAERAVVPYKQALLDRVGRSPEQLWEDTRRVQQHQTRIAPTLLHGDAHIGNTYVLPDGKGGLIDWQLMVRGAWVHDVCYLIVSSLPVETRRQEDKTLLAFYLDRLAAAGVDTPPDFDAAWEEYRRAAVWGFTVGWLTTPPANYGMEITTGNLERLLAACEDLQTFELIDRMD